MSPSEPLQAVHPERSRGAGASFDFSADDATAVHDALATFHPVVRAWFHERLGEPTAPQLEGWPLIRAGRDVLISAPTGSGKTLTAFLACLDGLFRQAADGTLTDETTVLYVSPLKALGNDVQKNLLTPLQQLRERAAASGFTLPDIRVKVRSGDTTPSERASMVKKPPHILITTPESLYLYLTAERSRETLKGVRTVIVDELHALAKDKRGSHFALSMERLKHVIGAAPQLIGLSATSRPLEGFARFLTGASVPGREPCAVVEIGHVRAWALTIETPQEELTAVATQEMWGQLYDRVCELTATHRTMLVFTNTRRLAERMAHDLGERLGHAQVAAHHGSMARELRLGAEERLKAGTLKVMVATASLELGIDIGAIDLVVQVGSPRSIAVMLQRLGRSGHHKAAVSKGLLFAMSRDELLECTALVRAIHEHRLDVVRLPEKPLDVLAQQVVAEVAAQDWSADALFELFKGATPYAGLTRPEFDSVLQLVGEGVSTTRGRSRVHVHHDRVNGVLRARRGARMMALQNGGAIPDLFSYPVIAEPEEKQVGTVDEDFAIDSMAGDVFVLGSTSWLIRRIFGGQVRVENARGQSPNVPFWRGEAPARTDELSTELARLRTDLLQREDVQALLVGELRLAPHDADLLVRYVRAAANALGAVPTKTTVIAERFFDEAGGMQLIIHAPFGARINRAWGMALRKSFCRTFDFELQAAASDDGILLSLSEQHSFPLMDIFDFVSPKSAERVLAQAVLQAPMFGTRFRWAAGRALALSRLQNGKRVPPPLQRARAEDLIAAVFPEQAGCQDNHGGMELEVPDHPLVNETMKDCLRDYMDVDGLIEVLEAMRDGRIEKRAVDLPEPSVFAHQLLNSAPYTFLDDAPLEERRARAVSVRRTLPPSDAAAFGALDAAAIETVISDAAPVLRDAEELHDALLQLTVWPVDGLDPGWLAALAQQGRASAFTVEGRTFAYAAERVPVVRALWPESAGERGDADPCHRDANADPGHPERSRGASSASLTPLQPLPGDLPVDREVAARQVVRGWMEILGPITAPELMSKLRLTRYDVDAALAKLEGAGQVLRGQFRAQVASGEVEWCDRRLLQRIHRLTVGRLRREIEPLSAQDFMRFLFRWHHVDAESKLRGPGGVAKVVELLQGFEAPAAAWEQDIFPSRMRQYVGEWLEHACFSGEVAWGRLTQKDAPPPPGPRRGTPVSVARGPMQLSGLVERGFASPFTPRGLVERGFASPFTPSGVEGPASNSEPSPRPPGTTQRRPLDSTRGDRRTSPSSAVSITPPSFKSRLSRAASLTFARRAELDWLLQAARPAEALADGPAPWPADLSAPARELLSVLERRGASFFAELQLGTKRLPTEVEDGLWELLSRGLITADAVQNLRVLQSPKARRRQRALQRGGPGRWSLLQSHERSEPAELEEKLAWLFLKRYGLVFRDLVAREPLAPPWRELLHVFRRLEARGEVRGGRFLSGFAGEQFALPEAVELSRAVRRLPLRGETLRIAAVDPLNLTGVVTPGPRVPAQLGQFVIYVDGVPGEVEVAEAPRLDA